MKQRSYSLWSLTTHGEPLSRLQVGLTHAAVSKAVVKTLEDSGMAALKSYAIRQDGTSAQWTASQWWGMMRIAEDKLAKVSADLVISELIRDQMDHNHPGNASGQTAAMAMQQMVRSAVAVIHSLGFEVARKVDEVEHDA